MKQIVIASGNAHKIEEFKQMFSSIGIEAIGMKELGEFIEPEETGETFGDNAKIKAEALCRELHKMVLSDDSGLVIDALGGDPGVHSARYMGHDTSYDVKNAAILELLKDREDRACRFVCAIALARPNQETLIFQQSVEGTVAQCVSGKAGFGYDPIFYYPPFEKTLADVSEQEKNSISHRGKAMKLLMEYLANEKA